jgi:hypothetical protein
MKEKNVTLDLWHKFTPEELDSTAQFLASETIRHSEVEIEKKTITDAFKERLAAIEATVWMLSRQVRERGMTRAVECLVHFHTPAVGKKQIIRLDTGEICKEEAMTPMECQVNLFSTEPIGEQVMNHIAQNAESIGEQLSTKDTKVSVSVKKSGA